MINKLKEGHWPIFLLSSMSSMANLFLPIILVRILAPSQIGTYKIFFLYLSAIPFFLLSGGPINSVYYWIGKPENESKKYIQASWLLSTGLSSVIFILGLPFIFLISTHLNFPIEYTVLMLICSFFWCPSSHYAETHIARGQTVNGALFSSGFEIIKVITFISLAYFYKNVYFLFFSFAIILALKFLVTLIVGLKQETISFEINKKYLKSVWVYCLPISAAGALGFIVDKIDQLILASYLQSQEFAFYTMGCLVVPPLIMIDISVQKVLIPNLSKNYAARNLILAGEQFKKSISDISFLIIPAIAGLYFFATPITTLLYTEQYIDSVPFLRVFAFSYLLFCIPHDAVPRATGNTGWIFKIYLIITPISLITVYFFATNFDALTTLIAALTIKFIPKIAGILYSKKIMSWKLNEMIPYKRVFSYTFLSALLCFLSQSVKAYFHSELNWFFVCAPSFAIIYLSSTVFFIKRLNRDNK